MTIDRVKVKNNVLVILPLATNINLEQKTERDRIIEVSKEEARSIIILKRLN